MSTYMCVRNSAWHVVGSNAATIVVTTTNAPKKPERHPHGGPDTCVRRLGALIPGGPPGAAESHSHTGGGLRAAGPWSGPDGGNPGALGRPAFSGGSQCSSLQGEQAGPSRHSPADPWGRVSPSRCQKHGLEVAGPAERWQSAGPRGWQWGAVWPGLGVLPPPSPQAPTRVATFSKLLGLVTSKQSSTTLASG